MKLHFAERTILLSCAGFVIFILLLAMARVLGVLPGNQSEWGTFGDFFGGVLNPILSFITIVLILRNLRMEAERGHEERNRAYEERMGYILENIDKELTPWRHPSRIPKNSNEADYLDQPISLLYHLAEMLNGLELKNPASPLLEYYRFRYYDMALEYFHLRYLDASTIGAFMFARRSTDPDSTTQV